MSDCEVLKLAKQFDELARVSMESDRDDSEALYMLADAASRVPASSHAGVSFLLMAAAAELEMTTEADTPDVRISSKERMLRLVRSALAGLGDNDALRYAHEYLIGKWSA